MTATATRPTHRERVGSPPSRTADPGTSTTPARSPRSRSTARIAIGVLVVSLSALGAAVLFSSAAERVTVIGVARDVPIGQKITEADLREVSIAGGSGLQSVPADDAATVVGRTASVQLIGGSLLSPRQLADGPSLPDGTVIAGAVLKGGQYPVGLSIGDTVDVIETTSPDASGVGEPVVRGRATVMDIAEPDDGQSQLLVSLAVPSDSATAVSSAGAAGRISVVVTAP